MADERRPLTPEEFGHAVSQLLACIWRRPDLSAWGAKHAAAFDGIADTHPKHLAAARAAYAARLRELRGEPK